ncbi:SET domain-containing protein [Ceraceosorus guamensis]|uniref:SET domain-containing protein n=1 Tax=Ceraceosorus guamensis TaxID=1522189 RepID=A0A316W108_9BASI|nr:SET domain-containing protein [Ceraceosorus guamensis]PWN43184.1 SET domain-containing protein [Ceraceosorus guamensis]
MGGDTVAVGAGEAQDEVVNVEQQQQQQQQQQVEVAGGARQCRALLHWFQSQSGAQLHPAVEAASCVAASHGNGLFAKHDIISKNASILRVPVALCIHPNAALDGIAKLLSVNVEQVKRAFLKHQLAARDAIVLYVALADHLCKLNQSLDESPSQSTSSNNSCLVSPTSDADEHTSRPAHKRIERGKWPSSDHDPYIRALPSHFLLPTFYTPTELHLFHHSPIESHALRCLEKYSTLAARASAALHDLDFEWSVGSDFEESGCLLNRWRWSDACYTSRAFPPRLLSFPDKFGQDEDDDDAPVLIPVLDLLNHQPKVPVTWIAGRQSVAQDGDAPLHSSLSDEAHPQRSPVAGNGTRSAHAELAEHSHDGQGWAFRWPPDDAYVELVLHATVEAGSEIFNNYGYKSSEEFLASYGFVSEYHAVSLRLVAADTEALSSIGGGEGSARPALSGKTHYWDGQAAPESLLAEVQTQCSYELARAHAQTSLQGMLQRLQAQLGIAAAEEEAHSILVRGHALHFVKTLLEHRCERLLKQCKRISRATGLTMSRAHQAQNDSSELTAFSASPELRLPVALLARDYTMGQVDCFLRCLDWVEKELSSLAHADIIQEYLDALEPGSDGST